MSNKTTLINKEEIEKETEKAIAIFVMVSRGEWWDVYSIWCPKSLTTIKENSIEVPNWILRKNAETLKHKYRLDRIGLGRDGVGRIA